MRSVGSLLAAASLMTAVTLTTTSAAAADGAVSLVTCTGTAHQTYDPGLTPETRAIHIVSVLTFDSCTDTGSGASEPISSAVIGVDYVTPANCLVAPPKTTTTVEIAWNDDQHSTADVTVVVTRTTGTTVVVSAGPITSGLFTGSTFSDQVTYLNPKPLDCLTGDGVTEISGHATLQVLTT